MISETVLEIHNLRGLAQMWVPTWGTSRVDVGADVGFVFWVR